jgi:hypothetical protein
MSLETIEDSDEMEDRLNGFRRRFSCFSNNGDFDLETTNRTIRESIEGVE